MWLMEERQKLQDLETVVRELSRHVEAQTALITDYQAAITKQKAAHIVLQARLERLELPPSVQRRRPIPSDGSSLSAPSSASSSEAS